MPAVSNPERVIDELRIKARDERQRLGRDPPPSVRRSETPAPNTPKARSPKRRAQHCQAQRDGALLRWRIFDSNSELSRALWRAERWAAFDTGGRPKRGRTLFALRRQLRSERGCPHPRELGAEEELSRMGIRAPMLKRADRSDASVAGVLAAIQLRRERRRPRVRWSAPADHTAALDRSTELGTELRLPFRRRGASRNTRGRVCSPILTAYCATGRDRNDVTRHRSRVDDLCSPAGWTGLDVGQLEPNGGAQGERILHGIGAGRPRS